MIIVRKHSVFIIHRMLFYFDPESNAIKSNEYSSLSFTFSHVCCFRLYDDALTDLLAAKSLDPTNTELDRYINRLHVDLQHCHETLL